MHSDRVNNVKSPKVVNTDIRGGLNGNKAKIEDCEEENMAGIKETDGRSVRAWQGSGSRGSMVRCCSTEIH